MTVYVDGARRLRTTLKAAGSDLSDLKAANRRAAETVLPVARSIAPIKDGDLRATLRPAATARAGIVRAGFKRVPYAGVIHWGWPKKNIKSQPYLTTAAQITEPFWVEAYEQDLREAILKVKGK